MKYVLKNVVNFFFQEESHSNMFLYIHLLIPHQQQDSCFNLTSPIYTSLILYISPSIVLCKYPTSLSPNISFIFQASIKATHWEIAPPNFNNNAKGQVLANLSQNLSSPHIPER